MMGCNQRTKMMKDFYFEYSSLGYDIFFRLDSKIQKMSTHEIEWDKVICVFFKDLFNENLFHPLSARRLEIEIKSNLNSFPSNFYSPCFYGKQMSVTGSEIGLMEWQQKENI